MPTGGPVDPVARPRVLDEGGSDDRVTLGSPFEVASLDSKRRRVADRHLGPARGVEVARPLARSDRMADVPLAVHAEPPDQPRPHPARTPPAHPQLDRIAEPEREVDRTD